MEIQKSYFPFIAYIHTRRHGNGSAPRRLLLTRRFSFALKSPFAGNSSAALSPSAVRFENRMPTTILFRRFDFFCILSRRRLFVNSIFQKNRIFLRFVVLIVCECIIAVRYGVPRIGIHLACLRQAVHFLKMAHGAFCFVIVYAARLYMPVFII